MTLQTGRKDPQPKQPPSHIGKLHRTSGPPTMYETGLTMQARVAVIAQATLSEPTLSERLKGACNKRAAAEAAHGGG